MNKHNLKHVDRCPCCYEWYPIENMREVIIDIEFEQRGLGIFNFVDDSDESNKFKNWYLNYKTTTMCIECIGRIDARS